MEKKTTDFINSAEEKKWNKYPRTKIMDDREWRQL